MVMPNMSVSAGGGGPSGSDSSAGVQTSANTPFNFDGSGWVINFGGSNKVNADGNSGANTATMPQSGAGGGLLAGIDSNMLLLGGAVLLLMMRKK